MPIICPECGTENSSSNQRCKVCNEQLKHMSHRKKRKIYVSLIFSFQCALLVSSFFPVLFTIGEFDAKSPDWVNLFFSTSALSLSPGIWKNLCAAIAVLSLAVSAGIYFVIVTGKHIRRKYKYIIFSPLLSTVLSMTVVLVANVFADKIIDTKLATVKITVFGALWLALHIASCIITYKYSQLKK